MIADSVCPNGLPRTGKKHDGSNADKSVQHCKQSLAIVVVRGAIESLCSQRIGDGDDGSLLLLAQREVKPEGAMRSEVTVRMSESGM
jgi:hypothetical protein